MYLFYAQYVRVSQTGSKVFHCIDQSLKSTSVASANSDKVVRIWDTRVGGTLYSVTDYNATLYVDMHNYMLYMSCYQWLQVTLCGRIGGNASNY